MGKESPIILLSIIWYIDKGFKKGITESI